MMGPPGRPGLAGMNVRFMDKSLLNVNDSQEDFSFYFRVRLEGKDHLVLLALLASRVLLEQEDLRVDVEQLAPLECLDRKGRREESELMAHLGQREDQDQLEHQGTGELLVFLDPQVQLVPEEQWAHRERGESLESLERRVLMDLLVSLDHKDLQAKEA